MEKYATLLEGLDIEISGSKLSIEGKEYTQVGFRNSFFEFIDMDKPEAIELMLLEKKDTSSFKKITQQIFELIRKELKPSLNTSLTFDTGLTELTPVANMEDGEVFLINEAHDIVSEINYKAWCRGVDIGYRKMVESEGMPVAKFIFDPYDLTKIRKNNIDTGTREMIFINTYTTPTWRSNTENTPNPFLQKFLSHLFGGKKEHIDYCMSWMAEAVWGRNETYLVLNGSKGVGKNTLYEIMKAVIGPRYCVTAPKSLTTSQFNGALKDRRLILLDEYKITRAEHMNLKKIINKNQTIEKKGMDADREIETFNSFMVFHNDVSDMYLERDDRRFSVLDITSRNLLELWSGEEITQFLVELNDPKSDLVAAIGNELLEWRNSKVFEPTNVFKGEKFHEIVEYHMPTWLQIVVAMIENGEVKGGEISFKKEIEKRLSTEMMGKKKIQWRKSTLAKILKDYKYKGEWKVGTISKEDRGLNLIINPELLEQFDHYHTDVVTEEEDDLL